MSFARLEERGVPIVEPSCILDQSLRHSDNSIDLEVLFPLLTPLLNCIMIAELGLYTSYHYSTGEQIRFLSFKD